MDYLALLLKLESVIRDSITGPLVLLQEKYASWILPEHSMRTILSLLTVASSIGMFLLLGGLYLSKTRLFRRIVLSTVQAAHQGYTARVYPDSLIGLQGTARTPLRPAGKAMIRGVCYDVKTLGTYIAPGETVVVTEISGTSLTVQATTDQA